ncbi:hypothetical protein D6774_04765 [Candidatus Woesearchaeota archaeon]|nr:MAG: hypothetical protein D6774_04765 [Candidatus Woesearchaeota archaeon]
MLDKNDLSMLREQLDRADEAREQVIKQSREVVRKSKEVIYALHRDDATTSKKVQELEELFKKLYEFVKDKPRLLFSGSFKVAAQEYAEARILHDLLTKKRIPTSKELQLEPEHYLLGLIDVTGELVRRAINQSIKGNTKDALMLKDAVSEIYDELMLFEFSNGELRKKFDSIKYDLQKLENLILDLHLTGKL